MISTTYSVDTFRFADALKKFWAYSHKSLGEVTRAQARLFAVELANRTQPFGSGPDAQFTGKQAVRRDIRRVFVSASTFESSDKHGLKAWLTKAVEAGNIAEIQTAVKRFAGRTPLVSADIVRDHHRSQRNARGRVGRSAIPMFILKRGAVERYTAEKEKLVGFGKSGWSQAARDLGGTRGIPGWVSRNRGPGSGRDLTQSKNNPRVELANDVRYCSDILPPREIETAARIQAEKMEKAIEKALAYEANRTLAS